jgi:hypothetical protein
MTTKAEREGVADGVASNRGYTFMSESDRFRFPHLLSLNVGETDDIYWRRFPPFVYCHLHKFPFSW